MTFVEHGSRAAPGSCWVSIAGDPDSLGLDDTFNSLCREIQPTPGAVKEAYLEHPRGESSAEKHVSLHTGITSTKEL